MATGLDNLWIYKLAEEYTLLIKGISGYMKFLRLNELDNHMLKSKPKKPGN